MRNEWLLIQTIFIVIFWYIAQSVQSFFAAATSNNIFIFAKGEKKKNFLMIIKAPKVLWINAIIVTIEYSYEIIRF